jgi:hypothetical protein
MLERLNSLWVGEDLSYIEQLCLLSAKAVGHPFTLYSYQPDKLRNVPKGIELRDAREVMSEPHLTRYFDIGWAALGSDFFRYALLAKNIGFWVDMDCYFLKALDFDTPYVFGWENERTINGAVLRIPAQSDLLEDLRTLPTNNWCPPFFGPKRKLAFYWTLLTNGSVMPEHLPWGSFGPALITYLVKKHGVASYAQPKSVFYPVSYDDSELLLDSPERVETMIRPDTRVIHMWHSKLKGNVMSPRCGSYLHTECLKHGINTLESCL